MLGWVVAEIYVLLSPGTLGAATGIDKEWFYKFLEHWSNKLRKSAAAGVPAMYIESKVLP